MKKEKTTLLISGMDCASCALSIDKGLKALDGVLDAKVNYLMGKAIVEFDSEKIKREDLVRVVEKTGYKVVK